MILIQRIFIALVAYCVRFSAVIAVSIISFNSANAAQWGYSVLDSRVVIWMDGPIEFRDDEQLQDILDTIESKVANPDIFLLVRSPGGFTDVAEKIMLQIVDNKIAVVVPSETTCASACFHLFAASQYRMAASNAHIGVHSFAVKHKENYGTITRTVDTARMFKKLGVPFSVIGKMTGTPPESISYLDATDLNAMNVHYLDPSSGMYYFKFNPTYKPASSPINTTTQSLRVKCIVNVPGADYLNVRDRDGYAYSMLPNGMTVYIDPTENTNINNKWVFVRFNGSISKGGTVFRNYLSCTIPAVMQQPQQQSPPPQPTQEPASPYITKEAAPQSAPAAPKPKAPALITKPAPMSTDDDEENDVASFKPRLAVPPRQ